MNKISKNDLIFRVEERIQELDKFMRICNKSKKEAAIHSYKINVLLLKKLKETNQNGFYNLPELPSFKI